MSESASIMKLTAALCEVQKQLKTIPKNAINTQFSGHKYSDLATVWEHCREVLTDNGFAVIQAPEIFDGQFVLRTILSHGSGEWVDSKYLINPANPNNPQGIASCITYARRYSLCAMVGLTSEDEDDDGNKASETKKESQPKKDAGTPLPQKPDAAKQAVLNKIIECIKAACPEDADDAKKAKAAILKAAFNVTKWKDVQAMDTAVLEMDYLERFERLAAVKESLVSEGLDLANNDSYQTIWEDTSNE